MLKTKIAVGLASLALGVCAFAAPSANVDGLGLSGTYMCSGYDMHDGGYQNALLTLTVDTKDSDFANNYGAYHFKLNDPDGGVFVGEVAASGNNAAVYFQNTNPSRPTDRGVGIAVITHDKDTSGKITTVLHKFYYEPAYEGGGNGSETCVKQS